MTLASGVIADGLIDGEQTSVDIDNLSAQESGAMGESAEGLFSALGCLTFCCFACCLAASTIHSVVGFWHSADGSPEQMRLGSRQHDARVSESRP